MDCCPDGRLKLIILIPLWYSTSSVSHQNLFIWWLNYTPIPAICQDFNKTFCAFYPIQTILSAGYHAIRYYPSRFLWQHKTRMFTQTWHRLPRDIAQKKSPSPFQMKRADSALLRLVGLEPTRHKTQEPKSCASANSAITACLIPKLTATLLYRNNHSLSSFPWHYLSLLI